MTQERIRILELERQVAFFIDVIKRQEAEIMALKEELSFFRTKKDSNNSSLPPSQDPYRIKRTESLRERSGRKPGGQLGHLGSCLEMTSEPTEIVEHHPNYCRCCGKDLSEV